MELSFHCISLKPQWQISPLTVTRQEPVLFTLWCPFIDIHIVCSLFPVHFFWLCGESVFFGCGSLYFAGFFYFFHQYCKKARWISFSLHKIFSISRRAFTSLKRKKIFFLIFLTLHIILHIILYIYITETWSYRDRGSIIQGTNTYLCRF